MRCHLTRKPFFHPVFSFAFISDDSTKPDQSGDDDVSETEVAEIRISRPPRVAAQRQILFQERNQTPRPTPNPQSKASPKPTRLRHSNWPDKSQLYCRAAPNRTERHEPYGKRGSVYAASGVILAVAFFRGGVVMATWKSRV